jgi:hypothetical protein
MSLIAGSANGDVSNILCAAKNPWYTAFVGEVLVTLPYPQRHAARHV